jgi:hypothetical protein
MNIKAIIASLVVGSSSAAMAAPSVTISAHGTIGNTSYATTVVRNRPAPIPQPIAQPVDYRAGGVWRGGHRLPPVFRPVVLANGLSLNGGRSFIAVGAQQGRFGTLQISGATGRTFIKQVFVQFDNGQTQIIRNLDRTLTPNQGLTVDLDGNRRAIARIVVYGSELLNGWRRSGGTFTVTAS